MQYRSAVQDGAAQLVVVDGGGEGGGGASDGGDGGGMSHLAPLMYSPKYFPVVPFLASQGSIYSTDYVQQVPTLVRTFFILQVCICTGLP